ncbi:MAG TPA: hypothetical protein VN663_13285 [Ramlibacter sp.]|nr:hypothetical protein [Ramlibacter sp.]
MDETVYHVLLEGRTVGPYDRRTIVGMRIKKTLTSDHVLISTDGAQLTVADLIGQRAAQPFNPERSGGFSIVQATFSASLLEVDGPGIAIPKFKDEIQARVQGDVLRLAGRFRHGLGWKEDRIKIVLKDVVHARVRGSQVELWLRNAESRLQRIALELFTAESAGEFADWLPAATPFPEPVAVMPAIAVAPSSAVSHTGLWVAVLGLSLVMAMMLMVLVLRRG